MVENSFEGYIALFIFYILLINYATYMDQNLIFGPNWVKNTIVPLIYMFNLINTPICNSISSLFLFVNLSDDSEF